ncbi:MAG: type I-U CRISPR-associated protein Csb2, partial [Gemmataceae bacterium]
MTDALRFTVRFLQPYCHGHGDGGEPEWPPSPLRLFQALVAASAARWNERQRLDYAVPALNWLELLNSPEVVAPSGVISEVHTQFYVPETTADLLVPQFEKGVVDATPKRTEKVVRPTHLSGEAIHYLYPLAGELTEDEKGWVATLAAAARSITHLGWGIDMVAADAAVISSDDADKLSGHRWREVKSGGVSLRVPKAGTLVDLMRKHAAFLDRLSADGFKPVPPLSCFDVKQYHSPTVSQLAPVVRPFVAFQILAPDASKVRSFGPLRGVRDVAAWVRNATAGVCAGWPFGDVAGFVHGHDQSDSNKP